MKRVLVMGAGLVAKPLVRYLLDQEGTEVIVASRTVSKAEALVGTAGNGKALRFVIDDRRALFELVAQSDLAISLLPAAHHPDVAQACLSHRKHMVTTSYVSPKMQALDGPARQAGVILLNETGLDPGIDHMSAMKIIDDERAKGARIRAFRSYCGGLPAPEANTNPWGYKFSWSPRGVVLAAKNKASYLKDGVEIHVPAQDLFADVHNLQVDDIGTLEAYPNRDSLGYIQPYNLEGISTMYRGTFRYPGSCSLWHGIVKLGLLDERELDSLEGLTYAGWMRNVIGCREGEDLPGALAARLQFQPDSEEIRRISWLGLFEEESIPLETGSNLDILCHRLLEKLTYEPRERDMIVMRHVFEFEGTGGAEPAYRITSTLVDFGEPGGDSSMSRTVGLPAAIAAKLVLEGEIRETGVHIPVKPSIYNPILNTLADLGIRFIETKEKTT